MFVTGVRDKPMKMAKRLMVFWLPFALNKEYEGNYKGVPVSKLVEVVQYVRKGAKFGYKKVNSGQDICSKDASVGNGKNFE